jgi:histidine triad (HIT) family protein
MNEKSIFEKIIDREIPADIVYEDEHCLAFRDIEPQAPIHVLLIPKKPITSLDDLTEPDHRIMGHLVMVAPKVAAELGVDKGYRLVCNCGPDAGQLVPHIHFHLLAGRPFGWPPG